MLVYDNCFHLAPSCTIFQSPKKLHVANGWYNEMSTNEKAVVLVLLNALQRKRKHAWSQQLERNMSKGIHSKNNEHNTSQKTPKNQHNRSQCQSIQSHWMPGSPTCPLLSSYPKKSIIDLAKAFDTVNHSLMLLILTKYGVPSNMMHMIKKLYVKCFIQLKLRETNWLQNRRTTGWQHGPYHLPVYYTSSHIIPPS